MDSQGFLHLVRNFTSLNEEENEELARLSSQHPYSQLIHLLRARAAQNLNHDNASEVLHTAAVYSTDRTVLKWVMTVQQVARVQIATTKEITEEVPSTVEGKEPDFVVTKVESLRAKSNTLMPEVHKVNEAASAQPMLQLSSETAFELSGDALREDLHHELERLQDLKHKFEASVEEFQKSTHGDTDLKRKSKSPKETDPLLAEIKSTKKKLKVENPKQKEQNEIIDQFIKTKPVIPKVKPTTPATDLSEESSIFSDNIVSETLVELLLKQGKKEKAIEVLKKLIWKFPQKKAYFAAQIEDLKN